MGNLQAESHATTSTTSGVLVVTGAASGIGLGIAQLAAERKMTVVLVDVNEAKLEAAVTELQQSGHKAHGRVVDVRDYAAVDELAGWVDRELGGTDILVNNAGIESHGLIWETDPAAWERLFAINVNGVFHGLRAFIPRMIARGLPAHVSTVASTAGLGSRGVMAPYIASKHALMGLVESLDLEFRQYQPLLTASIFIPNAVRSAIFEDAEVSEISEIGESQRQAMIRRNVRDGLPALEAASMLFDGIERGDLWIHTHPEASLKRVRERADALLSGRRVDPPWEEPAR